MNLEGLVVTPREQSSGGRRIVSLAAVIALHVALVAALVMSLGEQAIDVLRKPLVAKIIAAPKPPPPKPLPPTSPRTRHATPPPPPAYVPPSEVPVRAPSPVTHAITAVTTVMPPPAPAPRQVVRMAPVLDAAHSCPEPKYPLIARRLEESGTVTLRFLIGVDGHVMSGSVEQSSGYKMLDDAALRALSLCRFKPGTVDGQPLQSWANLKYVWNLEE